MNEFSRSDLLQDIKQAHGRLNTESGSAPKSWLVTAVVSLHTDVTGEDANFALYCAKEHVSYAVDQYIRGIKQRAEESDAQGVLEGWDHLQREYVIQREGESVVVSIDAMTFEEGMAKAAEHEAHAMGSFAHARELRRYFENKRAAEVAAGG